MTLPLPEPCGPNQCWSSPEHAREKRHGMEDLDLEALAPTVPRDLHETAGIACDHDARARLADPLDFPPPQLVGDAGLDEVVHAGAAAAEVAVGQLHEREPRNPPQQLAR